MDFQKLPLTSESETKLNLDALYKIAPSCFTEAPDPKDPKKLRHVVDFKKLRQLLGDDTVEDEPEAYEFTWVGKQAARREAATPINKTLRPVPESSVDWDHTQNIYIEGNNLDALKLLLKAYLGKIKMIYVDPPYNTGKNLIYHNNYSVEEKEFLSKSGAIDENNNKLVVNPTSNGRFHSDWCSMIYSRLLVCRSLLSQHGIICLTIDDSEIENVTAIMNEVFGETNHLATIVVKNNPSGRSTTKGASISHEYALFYSADEETTLGRLPRNDVQIARYKEKDNIGAFEWVNFRKHGGYKEDAPSMYYPIYVKKDCSSFRIPKLDWDDDQKEYKVLEKPASDEIVTLPIDEQGRPRRWKWGLDRALSSQSDMTAKKDRNGLPTVYIKSRMNDEGMLPLTVWDDKKYSSTEYGANLLKKLFNASYFDYPKSLYAVMDSLRIGNLEKDSIVLDFFSGSATTADAVMQLNAEDGGHRKYIMVQIPEKTDKESAAYKAGYKNICEIGEERIRRAGKKIKENSPLTTQDLDTGFRVYRIDSSNMKDVYFAPKDLKQQQLNLFTDNVKEDRTELDLLYGCMLDWGVELSLPLSTEKVDGCTVYTVNEGDLVACFEKPISKKVVEAIADKTPLRVLFRDSCFDKDEEKINIFEQFKQFLGWSDDEAMHNIRVI
jgi:adenine-specific DNA-methyltransferase